MDNAIDIILSRFYKFLTDSVPHMVVKRNAKAAEYETVESKRAGDTYVAALAQTDNWLTYPVISKSVLRKAGFNEIEIAKYSKDKNSIPKNRREKVIRFAREEFLASFEETNDYYRTLNGLPPINTDEEIWFEDMSIYDDYGIEPVPIHEIDPKYLLAMETRGQLQELKKLHPDAEYINYMGVRRIDIDAARRADNFAILYFPNNTESYSFYRNFLTYYEECREYFLTIIYNNFFVKKYKNYDGFIGFMILTMCINRMISSNFKAFIERDFYDELVVKTFLGAYGLTYDNRITLHQAKLLAKNLNILLRKKSTDEVLLDVLDLLGYSDYELMKYMLVRKSTWNADGSPVFSYKTVTDEDGNEHQELDPGNMYSYDFCRVSVKSNNIQESLHDTTKYLSYSTVTGPDPYWIEDRELQEKLANMKFNYIETKYMDLSITYRMYAIMFETVYFTRLVLDRRSETSKIYLNLSRLSYEGLPLFDILIFLICICCKYYGVVPELLKSPSKILYIMGFDFTEDLDAIKAEVEANPHLYDNRIIQFLVDKILITADDVNDMYAQIKGFDNLMVELLNNAHDLKTYRAYKKLYDTLFVEELNNTIYSLPDGSIPDTFVEYLDAYSPELSKIYHSLETKDECSELIGYVTERLMSIFTNTKYLQYIQVLDNGLIESIIKILCFFKSYTIDLVGVDCILLFDSRIHNCAHLYHKVTESGTLHIRDFSTSGEDSLIWDMIKKMELTVWMQIGDERAIADYLGRMHGIIQDQIRLETELRIVGYYAQMELKDNLRDTGMDRMHDVLQEAVATIYGLTTKAGVRILSRWEETLDVNEEHQFIERLLNVVASMFMQTEADHEMFLDGMVLEKEIDEEIRMRLKLPSREEGKVVPKDKWWYVDKLVHGIVHSLMKDIREFPIATDGAIFRFVWDETLKLVAKDPCKLAPDITVRESASTREHLQFIWED